MIAIAVFSPGTEFSSEKHIGDVSFLQCPTQALSVELRIHPAVWVGAHIAKRGDGMPFKQPYQPLNRVSRMSNCVDGFSHDAAAALSEVITAAASL